MREKRVPVRQYLDETVVPTLRDAMKELVKVRPEDPHEFVAKYMLKHSLNAQNAEKRETSSVVVAQVPATTTMENKGTEVVDDEGTM